MLLQVNSRFCYGAPKVCGCRLARRMSRRWSARATATRSNGLALTDFDWFTVGCRGHVSALATQRREPAQTAPAPDSMTRPRRDDEECIFPRARGGGLELAIGPSRAESVRFPKERIDQARSCASQRRRSALRDRREAAIEMGASEIFDNLHANRIPWIVRLS